MKYTSRDNVLLDSVKKVIVNVILKSFYLWILIFVPIKRINTLVQLIFMRIIKTGEP